MQIMKTEQLNALLAKQDELKQLFVDELNVLNNEYFPEFTAAKKERNNRLYGLGWTICLLVVVTFMVVFRAIEPLKLIYLLYIINGSFFFYALFLVLKTQKKLKEIKTDWDKKHEKIAQYKVQASLVLEQAKEQVYIVISENEKKSLSQVKEMIFHDFGQEPVAEELIAYYEAWGKTKTGQNIYDLQEFLSNRRRKAEMMTEKKENESTQ